MVEAMPAAIKVKLEDVVGLNTKSSETMLFMLTKDEKVLLRKLAQLHLEEMHSKKKKVQAMQKDHPAVMVPVNTCLPFSACQSIRNNEYACTSKKDYSSTSTTCWTSQLRVGGPPGVCWGCNQPGHNKRDCPINPWQQNQPMAPEVNYGQQQVKML
ncbi:hypothetical protein M9458_056783 [Cirrhinus mrigala]|uniref:CCHC-type domain-containing protein n=1 Tax=Cirrhinus mrigala TaxID=683832 RepID=A0ABD0MGZ3_CIRMR